MRTLNRPVALLVLFLAAPALQAQNRGQAPPAAAEKFPLTVDSIMRGPDLVGYAPDNLRWSADSQRLYFDWRKPGEEEASTYWVARDGGMATKLTDEQKKITPPANGRWDKAHKRVLFVDKGDVILLDAERHAPVDHAHDRRREQSAMGAA